MASSPFFFSPYPRYPRSVYGLEDEAGGRIEQRKGRNGEWIPGIGFGACSLGGFGIGFGSGSLEGPLVPPLSASCKQHSTLRLSVLGPVSMAYPLDPKFSLARGQDLHPLVSPDSLGV